MFDFHKELALGYDLFEDFDMVGVPDDEVLVPVGVQVERVGSHVPGFHLFSGSGVSRFICGVILVLGIF